MWADLGSETLRIQLTADELYQGFLPRSVEAEALGMRQDRVP
jgi:hypothetical protein